MRVRFERFQWFAAPFWIVSLPPTGKAPIAAAHWASRASRSFRKNNKRRQSICQEIVDSFVGGFDDGRALYALLAVDAAQLRQPHRDGQQFINPIGGDWNKRFVTCGCLSMTEFESSNVGRESADVSSASAPDAAPQKSATHATTDAGREPPKSRRSRDLVLVVERPEAKSTAEPRVGSTDRLYLSRLSLAAAAALAIVVAVAGALLLEDRQQAKALAEQASETESLAHTIRSLKVRLDAIDTARSSADLADLRQSVGEIKSTVVSTREVSGALAQLSQRVDKLDREESAKVDKLTERVDHEASAVTAGLSTRIDKLEQKIVSPPPQAAQAKQPSTRPKFAGAISMEGTGSIERPRPLLRGYIVLDARDDVALIGGRYGEREVRQGDFLPGAGRVERIELRGDGWVVTTSEGLIASADFPRY